MLRPILKAFSKKFSLGISENYLCPFFILKRNDSREKVGRFKTNGIMARL